MNPHEAESIVAALKGDYIETSPVEDSHTLSIIGGSIELLNMASKTPEKITCKFKNILVATPGY